MRRVFYIALGVTVGVIAMRRLSQIAESLSPDSVVASASHAVTDFVADVRAGMAEREAELRRALDVDSAVITDPALIAGRAGAPDLALGANDHSPDSGTL